MGSTPTGAANFWEEDMRSKPFVLYRHVDESGVSGTGNVAEGVIFKNGWVALCWLNEPPSGIGVYPDIATVERIHGHDGKTQIVYPAH